MLEKKMSLLFLLLFNGDGGVVVQALGGKHLRQLALPSRGLLQLGPLVLEPDLNLVLLQPQLSRKAGPAGIVLVVFDFVASHLLSSVR